jgi:hypothetical protein
LAIWRWFAGANASRGGHAGGERALSARRAGWTLPRVDTRRGADGAVEKEPEQVYVLEFTPDGGFQPCLLAGGRDEVHALDLETLRPTAS